MANRATKSCGQRSPGSIPTVSPHTSASTSVWRTYIEAGADMFLMPSRFEPCGLNQMYSLRYGTVPIVRATGGLEDTVDDDDSATGTGTGFKFGDYTPVALVQAVRRAVRLYADAAAWKAMQLAGMREDHSWDVSAREYVKVYRSATARSVRRRPLPVEDGRRG